MWKCSNTEFFLVRIFPHSVWIRMRSISPYPVRMRENTDQKKLRFWTLFTKWVFSQMKINIRDMSNIQLPHMFLSKTEHMHYIRKTCSLKFLKLVACKNVLKTLKISSCIHGLSFFFHDHNIRRAVRELKNDCKIASLFACKISNEIKSIPFV